MSKEKPLPPLEQGLLQAMRALDNQVAREMQRNPEQLSQKGAVKWEPFEKRIEILTAFFLEALGNDLAQLDSLLILSQATSKALSLVTHDLEPRGLGKVRTAYCSEALHRIIEDCRRAEGILKDSGDLN